MQLKEILLAIDPAMKRIEEILLWKNKFKTGVVFTSFHFLFWLLQTFNIRTYCTLSFILLCFHMLDAYRAKKRRHLIKMHQASPNLIETIIHYNIPRKLLNKAIPFLEQLDHSMKYERRSILERSELLVDVKLPNTSDIEADLEEDEYLRSFKLDNLEDMKEKQRRVFENLEDDDDEDEENSDEENSEGINEYDDEDENEDEDTVETSQSINLHGKNIKNVNLKENHHQLNIKLKNTNSGDLTLSKFKSKFFQNDDLDTDDSLLPNESFPTLNFGDNSSLNDGEEEEDLISSTNFRNAFNNSGRIRSNLVKVPVVKSRPSVLDYYKENNATTTTIIKPRTKNSSFQSSFTTTAPQSHLIYRNGNKENDDDDNDENKPLSPSKIPIGLKFNENSIRNNNDAIDETFDFLEEEY